MFGVSNLPHISAIVPKRAATRTALAVATASAAFLLVPSVANAQDCVGGYRMLKGEIPVSCQEAGPRALFSAGQPGPREPLHTGSIGRSEQPANAVRPSNSAATAAVPSGAAGCVNGMRFVETPNNGATLMIKCS